ncbi:TIGR02530 family flagellar biosynthesis protein [Rummeliibacillus pycnus]|uniref:TIGR02530 family flagellar biosynthesis protein n=1 Tax=Rummeliibacillus pycnus TaxID=101070 RepID=UPI003D27E60E
MSTIKYIQHQYPIHSEIQSNVLNVKPTANKSFSELLAEQTSQQLKVSKHASNRLQERNIHIDERQWERITNKVFEAKSKGVNDSLVLTNNAALIVSAKNATVITAMDRKEAQDQLFTNIDGTIVLG